MNKLSLRTKLRLIRMQARITRRQRRSRMLRSPLIGWLFQQGACDEIILVPSNLRTPDPSFIDEIRMGHLGLGGESVNVGSSSPFAEKLGSDNWLRELHGFGWLNHLTAADADGEGAAIALRLIKDWMQRAAKHGDVAWSVDVLTRRVIAWITHSDLILVGADADDRTYFMRSLGRQLHLLDILRREVVPGPDNLKALIALLLADLAIEGRDKRLARTESAFLAELKDQILSDGGHVSRNPKVALDIVLDLLPLRRCYTARDKVPPNQLESTIDNILSFLRAMRLGNGRLGCFNGADALQIDALATALSIDGHSTLSSLVTSGYVREEAGPLVLLMDCGVPPAPEHSRHSKAGCLSFEMSVGNEMVVVNGALPASPMPGDIAASRATANHSVLAIDGKSSGQLAAFEALDLVGEVAALIGPRSVGVTRSNNGQRREVHAWHDGYLASHELIHGRKISIFEDGSGIDGVDSLNGRSTGFRLRQDVPFAIRFHLSENATARILRSSETSAEIQLHNGVTWAFSAEGAELGIESAPTGGQANVSRSRQQIVLRGSASGAKTVTWTFRRRA